MTTPTTFQESFVALSQDRTILSEGPLARQIHDALLQSQAVEVSKSGLGLESEETDRMEMGSAWVALQAQNKGFAYGVGEDQAAFSDYVKFTTVVDTMTPEQRSLSALYLSPGDSGVVHLWSNRMAQYARGHGVTVIDRADLFVDQLHQKENA